LKIRIGCQSTNDNEAFADGVRGNVTASTKEQYQYIGTLFWDGSAQRVSVLVEREEEDYQQRGPLNWGMDPNQDRERDTDTVAVEYRRDESANTYRVEAVYQLNDTARLRSAYGTAVKNPTFLERFGFYTNFIGNANLEPEESTSWELGIDQQFGALILLH